VPGSAGGGRDQPVGDAGGEDAREERLAALDAPAADDVEAVLEPREQPRDVGRVVLSVAVERDDDGGARMREARRERRGLPEVAVQVDDVEVGVRGGERFEPRERAVAAAVRSEERRGGKGCRSRLWLGD